MSPLFRLDTISEFERYMKHENNVLEPGYQDFVRPLVQEVETQIPLGSVGLDFGSGPDSAAGHLLREKGYELHRYDPYFHPDTQPLNGKYDFLIACEVVEHFYHPSNSFQTLRNLLKPGCPLFIMTSLWSDSIDFTSWSYRRDSTHVSFYSQRTLEWIKERFRFQALSILSQNLVVFKS